MHPLVTIGIYQDTDKRRQQNLKKQNHKNDYVMKITVQTLLAAFSLLLVLTACGRKETVSEAEQFRSELTREDTTQMLALCGQCMETLKQGKIDEALSQMRLYNDSTRTVSPLSAEKQAELRRTFRLFPVIDYKLDYYSFDVEGRNDVKYSIEFFKKENPDDPTPNTIGFMFNPVKVDGQWYVTVKEADQDFNRARNR